MNSRWLLGVRIICLVVLLWATPSFGDFIDLNSFTPYSSYWITVDTKVESATFIEGDLNPVSLENLNLLVPLEAAYLSFDYSLVVPAENIDFFDFYIIDLGYPAFNDGGAGERTYFGSYSYPVSTLAGTTVPIIFDLMSDSGDGGFESTLILSNVRFDTTSPVPEPGTLLLLGSGLFGLAGLGLRKDRHP